MAFEEPNWRYLSVGAGSNPPETGYAATHHGGVKLPNYAVSMSPGQARSRGYAIDPHGYNPKSWFQNQKGEWFYAGDPSFWNPSTPTQNTIEWRVPGQGASGRISPPGGWVQGPGATSENPFIGGVEPDTGIASGTQSSEYIPSQGERTDNPFIGGYPDVTQDNTPTFNEPTQPSATPSELPSPAGEQVANQYQEPYNYQPPAMPEPTAGGDYGGGYPGPTPTELPSPSEIPFYEQQTAYPAEEPAPAGANVPTSEYGMTPTGPNEYLPSEGANVPTNEAMYPTDLQQYLPSDAGANIPTNEDVTATLAPDAFRPPDDTYSYPAGDGTYTKLDANGQPVAPAQPTFDVNYNPADTGPLYGDQKKPTTFFQDLGADVTDIGNVLGTATPANTALSGEPGFGAHPSSYTGPGGGAFWTPAGGVPLGPLGQGSHGMIPWEYYARMARARMIKGGDPTLGLGELNTRPGDTIARFQSGGTGYGGTNMMGGYGIRGRGGRVASAYVNPNFYAPPVPEASSQKPGGGAAAGGIGGGGPGGIP